jgi:hypothetical protein
MDAGVHARREYSFHVAGILRTGRNRERPITATRSPLAGRQLSSAIL